MRIHHLALRTPDVGRLERFYAGVLGLRAAARDHQPLAPRPPPQPQQGGRDRGGSVWLDAGGAILMLERAEPGEPPVAEGTRELVAFAVDDREAWRARLARAGVPVEAETAYTLYFRDPDGRRVAVSTYPYPPAP